MLLPFPARAPGLALDLGRCFRGLQRAELLVDLATGGPYTLVAPVDDAFDRMPWPFDRLIDDDGLIEPCVDLFEYSVIHGVAPAAGPVRRMGTLRGEAIHVGEGVIIGPGNTARIVASVHVEGFMVHITRDCVLPTTVLCALSKH